MISGPFITRPVLAGVISVVILLAGGIAALNLPVAQYPDITPPMIRVSASYSGASAEVVAEAVAAPIEQEINGSPNMLYMSSSCTNKGGYSLDVTFEVGTSPDIAAVEIQNRVQEAVSRLPAEVVQNGITVQKQSTNLLLTLALRSDDPKYDETYLSNFTTINVQDILRRVPGVARVRNVGARSYAMRVWLRPDRMASYGLTVTDVVDALREQNTESAAGTMGAEPSQEGVELVFPVRAQGRLVEADEFADIIVRANPDGSRILLRNIARVELGAYSYSLDSRLDGGGAAILDILLLPGANALQVRDAVIATMDRLAQAFPRGIEYVVPFDSTVFIRESIKEVYVTLIEALLLVIAVVFIFLQSWRTTLIPALAVPVSLVGSFAVMAALGFSLNTLTLLGLVLSIGVVVDDAIVVVENVERLMVEQGLSSVDATRAAMQELTSPILATSLVLAAVFVPVSFLGGMIGQLYRQFSVTIVISVLISTVVALTLSPALTAILLRRPGKKFFLFRWFNRLLEAAGFLYAGLLGRTIRLWALGLIGFALLAFATVKLMEWIPAGFLPEEDQGIVYAELQLPDGASLERTRRVMDRVEAEFLDHPAVDHVITTIGEGRIGGSSEARGTMQLVLKHWQGRTAPELHASAIMEEIRRKTRAYPESVTLVSTPPVIPGLGTSAGFEFQLESRGAGTLEGLTAAARELESRGAALTELADVSANMQPSVPQVFLNLDRNKTKALGVPVTEVFRTMRIFLDSYYVNDFNLFGRVYRVLLQGEKQYRGYTEDVSGFFVRNNNGRMIPVTALATLEPITGPGSVTRFNMFNAVTVRGRPAAGYSSGQAIAAMEGLADEVLPENYAYEWSGLSLQQIQAAGDTEIILVLALVFVYLFLCGLYESWTIPLAVLVIVPVALFGALAAIGMRGIENDIYFQIGLVALIGLSAKNAILIVEYAKLKRESGATFSEAAVEAARLRLRPVLMTAFSFILGLLPLVFAAGAGAGSRHSIGTGVLGGMIAATTLGLVFVPLFFVLIGVLGQKLRGRRAPVAALSVLLLACLSSCKKGPDYTRPDVPVPPAYRSPEALVEGGSIAELGWWELFQDEVLRELITTALEANKDLLLATERIEEARNLVRIARAGRYPRIDAASGLAVERDFGGGAAGAETEVPLSLLGLLSWELDVWGRIERLNEAARADFLAEQENQRAVVVSLVSDVARAYFELRDLDNQLDITERTLKSREQSLHIARLRFEGGLTSELVVKQTELQLANAQAVIPELRRQVAFRENELSILLGSNPTDIRRGLVLAEQPMPPEIPVGLPSDLLERRPDIRRAEQDLVAANALIGVAESEFFPRISLTGVFGLDSLDLRQQLATGTSLAAVDAVAPIFNAGELKGNLAAVRSRYEQTRIVYERVIQQAFREVSDALANHRETAQIRAAEEVRVAAARDYLRLARLQYANGVLAYLDVLDAERQLFDAELQLSGAITGQLTSVVDLYRALGGGWAASGGQAPLPGRPTTP